MSSINEPGYHHDSLYPGSINEPPVVPPGALAPKITSLSPNSVVVGSANFKLYLAGTGFFDKSLIFLNGQLRVTKLEADGRLSTTIRPTAWTPQTVKIQVRNGSHSTNVVDFVFTAAVEE